MFEYRPYVRVADRRREAAKEMERRRKKGQAISPVRIEGRVIAKTFWGKAWCENLERYSDYENRLPRGRTYVRNGSVVDLQVAAGRVTAVVSGSELYEVEVKVARVKPAQWTALKKECAGGISSLVDLLQGRLSQAVMDRICREKTGLFPAPRELELDCSCPDWADMCKHVAAVLYGIGARFDEKPELLFGLRGVDAAELIAEAGDSLKLAPKRKHGTKRNVLESTDGLSELFGIDLAPTEARPAPKRRAAGRKKV